MIKCSCISASSYWFKNVVQGFWADTRTGIGDRDSRFAAKKAKTQTINEAFNETANFFRRSVSGTLTNIDGDTLTVKQSSGQERKLTTNDKTTVTQKSKDMKLSDLKKDQKVIIQIAEANSTTAVRITIK